MLVYFECFNTVQIAHACLQRIFQCGRVYSHFTYNDIYICYNARAISVKGRIGFTTDLHAADAAYHTACDLSFITRKNLPKKYSENENFASPGLGRPVLFRS